MTAGRKGLSQRLRESGAAGMLRRRLRGVPPEPRWEGVDDIEAAADALVGWAAEALQSAPPGSRPLVVGDGGVLEERLRARLDRLGWGFESTTIDGLVGLGDSRADAPAIILCAFPDVRRITETAAVLRRHPRLAQIRFEYVSGVSAERATFSRLDEYSSTWFVSPVLLDMPSPYDLYAESLEHFEQKCGLRDFLDLYQLLRQVVVNEVPGDVAEFGSYRGHSGYLIARTLAALGSDKRLFMFDTFDSFPDEPLGVDSFWSNTHQVDFASVRDKFDGLERVTLVQGDFTTTLESSDAQRLALAYVDCDSYRATRYLIDAILPTRLESGGLLVFEDYGHPALLGNRLAVHEGMAGHPGCFCFYSQFSGLYISVKA